MVECKKKFGSTHYAHFPTKDYGGFMDIAASGAYYIAMATDAIGAHPTTVTGSVGVIMSGINVKEGLDKKMEVSFSQGKESMTRYRLVKKVGDYYCLVLKPYTGRKHQIRIHLSEGLQTPIVGDLKYGDIIGERMFLHAYKIVLPVGKDKIIVQARD